METELRLGVNPKESAISVNEHGQSVITGTRMRVLDVVFYQRNVTDAESYFESDYPHFTLAQFHSAMNYYMENKDLIDEEIVKERKILALMSKHSVPGQGVDFDALEADPEYQTLEQPTR